MKQLSIFKKGAIIFMVLPFFSILNIHAGDDSISMRGGGGERMEEHRPEPYNAQRAEPYQNRNNVNRYENQNAVRKDVEAESLLNNNNAQPQYSEPVQYIPAPQGQGNSDGFINPP